MTRSTVEVQEHVTTLHWALTPEWV